MLTRRDIPSLSAAAGSAAAAGLAIGLWLGLPSYLSKPLSGEEPQSVSAVDPNLARYQRMLVAEGVDPAPHILAAAYVPAADISSAAPPPDEDAALQAEIAREEAAYQDQMRRADVERVAWLDGRREAWRTEALAYRTVDEPAGTADEAEDEGPDETLTAERR